MCAKPAMTNDTREIYLDHAKGIGSICYFWSLLDMALVNLIQQLSTLDEKTTFCMLSTSRDTSQRCEIASRLVILKGPDCPWRDCLLDTLSVIQNKMCEKRNRIVHDEWSVENTEIFRTTRAVRMQMDSERVRQLTYETITPVQAGEIASFVKDISVALIGLIVTASDFRGKKSDLHTLKPLEPLLLLYKRYFPDKPQKSAPKPKRQQKPSRKK